MITILICTYNRCESLRETLVSILNLETNPKIKYEVLVMDNNSTDKTKEVVGNFSEKFEVPLRYILETRQGKSWALNTGIKEAKGDIIAFTDDDVIVDKAWLSEIHKAFVEHKCDGLGGKVWPRWEITPPAWLDKKLWGPLALIDHSDKAFYMTDKDLEFVGANCVYKKELFEKFGGYQTGLGPSGERLFRGEDTEVYQRFLAKQCKLLYSPDVVVEHCINKERINKKYFFQWYFDQAHSILHMKGDTSFSKVLFGIFDKCFSWCVSVIKGDPIIQMHHEIKLHYYLGQLQWKWQNLFKEKNAKK